MFTKLEDKVFINGSQSIYDLPFSFLPIFQTGKDQKLRLESEDKGIRAGMVKRWKKANQIPPQWLKDGAEVEEMF